LNLKCIYSNHIVFLTSHEGRQGEGDRASAPAG